MRGGGRGRATHFRRRLLTAATPLERILILLVVVALAGVGAGVALPNLSPAVSKVSGRTAASGPAADALGTLRVDDAPSTRGYDRDLFGYRETDDDGNGCDIREDILARDLKDVRYKAAFGRGSCQVASGVLDDPYTGREIRFTRGAATSAAVQIDHVVALENAWQSGASGWDAAERRRFGNDPYNLLAVDGPANQEKGSASAAYWLPTNGAFRCAYVARQIGVKTKYALAVTTPEKDAMLAVLRACPAQDIPGDDPLSE